MLEAHWSSDCGLQGAADPEDGYAAYDIDFRNSGGSVFYSDGVDFSARGWLSQAARVGRDVVLTIAFPGAAWRVRLRPLSPRRLQVIAGAHVDALVLQRCAGPDRRPVAGLSPALNRRFSKAIFSLLPPAPTGENLCKRFVHGSLQIDLAGPSAYGLDRYDSANSAEEYWDILGASPRRGGGLRLQLHPRRAGSQTQQLTLAWLDATHLRAMEWNMTYLRCP